MFAQKRLVAWAIWTGLIVALVAPITISATSPFLAGRSLAYIIASFAGIVCLGFFLLQPLLAQGLLPGLRMPQRRKLHRWIGSGIVIAVLLHIGGLYVTSPPDALDALFLASPTSFSVYGVIALWGVVLTGILALLRSRIRLRYATWRGVHTVVVLVVVTATVIHALQIEGLMGEWSKLALCIAVLAVTALALINLWVIAPLQKRRTRMN